tara:strand:- start:742 stop:1536 length:795 start_codon:yes stop_codon:yes gene_type:complete
LTTRISELPLLAPGKKQPRINFRKALRHFKRLIADKEDTAEVFHVVEALAGNAFVRNARNFRQSSHAREIMDRNVDLPAMLDDHDQLRRLPAGSLGQAYVRFMEKEGLTAAGLVAEYDRYGNGQKQPDDLAEWYSNRTRDTHDLFHVLTGYGRDALGEDCLLAFSYSQDPNLGIIFIAYGGGMEVKKELSHGIPVLSAIRQGQNLGKAAKRIAYHDIEKLLAMQLDDARKLLNVGEPTLYRKAMEMCRDQGIDPYAVASQTAAA